MSTTMEHSENLRVLVTGGAGFIGKHLIRSLLDEGYQVRSLDLKKPDIDHANLQALEGSFTDQECVQSALNGVDIVYHLASTTIPSSSNKDPLHDINTNLMGSVDLINQSIALNVKRFIFVSSGGTVYGVPSYLPVDEKHPTNPLCSYGIVKLAIEKYLLMYQSIAGMDSSIIRLANPYGDFQNPNSGQGVIAAFCHKAIRGEKIEIWGDGSVVRDYVHISDVIRALLLLITNEHRGGVYNIGAGQGYTLNQVIEVIESVMGADLVKEYMPGRSFDIPEVYLDTTKAENNLGWKARHDLSAGIANLINSIKCSAVKHD